MGSRDAAAPRPGRADLHTHTTASDGQLTSPQLVQRARDRQLAAIAITDHDTLAGIDAARTAAGDALTIIPGVELSCAISGVDVHLLGYGVAGTGALADLLAERTDERLTRAEAIARRLASNGAPIDLDRVLELAGPGTVGRPHIARALVEAGHVATVSEAFDRYLAAGQPGFIERPVLTPERAIAAVQAAGGAAVLAHPRYSEGFAGFLPGLAAAGLDGIEVVYPDHDDAFRAYLQRLAERHGLIATGGSDFHLDSGRVGRDLGDVTVPITVIERLAERAADRQRAAAAP